MVPGSRIATPQLQSLLSGAVDKRIKRRQLAIQFRVIPEFTRRLESEQVREDSDEERSLSKNEFIIASSKGSSSGDLEREDSDEAEYLRSKLRSPGKKNINTQKFSGNDASVYYH